MADIGIRIGLQGATAVQTGLNNVATTMGRLDDATLKVGNAFRALAPTIAGALSVGALVGFTREAINTADAAGKLAASVGLAVGDMAGLQLALSQSGVAAEQLGPAMSKLATAIANGNQAFTAMGVATKNVDGSLRTTREVLGDVASRFASYADGAGKTALAVKLFGDELGTRLVPFLNNGAAGLASFDAQAARLGLTLDSEATSAAANFNDQLDLLRARAQGAVQSIGLGLLPVVNELLSGFSSATDATDRYKGVVEALRIPLEAISIAAANVKFVLESVGREIGAVAAQIVTLGQLDIDGFNAISEAVKEDGRRARAELDAFEQRVLNAGRTAATTLATATATAAAAASNRPTAPTINTTATDPFGDFAARQLAAQRQREIDARLKAEADLTVALRKEEAERIAGLDRQAEADRRFVEAIVQGRIDAAAASAASVEGRLADLQAEEQAIALAAAQNISLAEAIERVAIARLQEQSVGLDPNDPRAQAIDREIAARERLLELMGSRAARDANRDAAQAAARDWEQVTAQIGQSLTDALMSGSMKAGDFIKNLFKTMVLRPVIQAVMNPVMGAIGSGLGLAGSAAAATGGGGGGGLGGLSLISTGLQMASGFGGLAGAGAAMTLAGNTGMALSAASAAMSAGSVGAGLSIGVGAIAPFALGAIAVISLLRRRLRDAGIEGTFGPEGFTGNQFKDWSGGLFTSAKTNRTALDQEVSDGLARTFTGIRDNVRDLAATLGIAGDSIETFSRSVRISTKGLKPEEIQAAWQREFDAIGEELAALALGATTTVRETVQRTRRVDVGFGDSIETVTETYFEEVDRVIAGTGAAFLREGETAAQALQRLSTALTTVNPMLDVLGQQMFDVGIAGADLASQLADLFGSPEAFTQIAGQYYQQFYTEAERTATTTRLLTEELAGLGLTLPANREAFRALVEAQDLTTESGRATYAALLQMSGAFSTITPELDALADAGADTADTLRRAAEIANERAGLERQLLELQGDTAAIRALERAALDESNRALYDQITALQDTQAAAQAAADAEAQLAAERERIAQERSGLERQLLDLQGDTAAIRALERAALDESNRALYDRITALQDSQAAEAAAARAAEESAAALVRAANDFAAVRQQQAQAAASATDAAFAAVRRAVEAEAQAAEAAMRSTFELLTASIRQQQQAATAARDAAAETLQSARQVFDFLAREIADLRGLAGAGMSGAQARAFIDAAISAARTTGTLPDQDTLAQAVSAARGELDPGRFATAFEQRRDTLLLANRLADLQDVAGAQATVAERALQVAQDQLAALEQSAEQARADFDANIAAVREGAATQLAAAQAQLDALRGIDTSVLTVAAAIDNLAVTLSAEQAARAAAATAQAQAAATSRAGRSPDQLAEMLPGDFFDRDAAGKIAWFNANAISVSELASVGVPWEEVEWMLRNGYRGFDANIAAVREGAATQLAAAQAQLDALRGIDTSVLTVAAAIDNLAVTLSAEQAARAVAATAQAQAARAAAATAQAQAAATSRSPDQLAEMLPGDFFDRDAAGKIAWFNANAISVSELTGVGVPWEEVDWMLRNGYRGFAAGGLHTGGLRLVGERGPELEVTGPARYYSFEQTREMLGNTQRREESLVAEIRALREDNAAQARAIVAMQQRMNRVLERWDGDGLPEERAVA